jgi:hypothetical protein
MCKTNKCFDLILLYNHIYNNKLNYRITSKITPPETLIFEKKALEKFTSKKEKSYFRANQKNFLN